MFYAELNEAGICFAVTQPGELLVGPQFVPVASLDPTLIGKRWTGTAWVTP